MRCIPRDDMPQIDMADMPALFNYLRDKGMPVVFAYVPTMLLVPRQCVADIKPIPDREVLLKPILAARDRVILDGNSRWVTHKADHSPLVPCFLVGTPFATALPTVLKFPKTYEYGDGHLHPITY